MGTPGFEPGTSDLDAAKAAIFYAFELVRVDGIEPSAFALSEQRSTTELHAQKSEPRS